MKLHWALCFLERLALTYSLFSWKKLYDCASFEGDVHPRKPALLWHSRIRPPLICYLSTVNLIWKLSFVWYMWTSN